MARRRLQRGPAPLIVPHRVPQLQLDTDQQPVLWFTPSSTNPENDHHYHQDEGRTTMSDMKKAVCWELETTSAMMLGLRVLLAGQFVGIQELSSDNARPRWKFSAHGSPAAASEAAVRLTEAFEKDWSGKLIVPPGEIVLHPSEEVAMAHGNPISPALRARIFTSLQRRDPRVPGVPAVGGESGAAAS